jgi:2-keto-4-pentenoate hydratase
MHADAARQAAELLWSRWQAGTQTGDLPPAIRPLTRADGYDVQAHLDARTTRPLFGWKIAATSLAGQQHIGVDGPLAGRIRAEQMVAPGTTVSLSGNHMRLAEVEFAFRMARDLPPRGTPYTVEEVMAAVESLHPAIELPDTRFAEVTTAGAAQLIADCACAHQLAVGAAAPDLWRTLDLTRHRPVARIPGRADMVGLGANVLGDPRVALTWIANELSGIGLTLKAGETVTTGTCLVPIPVVPGDRLDADYGTLGTISLAFSD